MSEKRSIPKHVAIIMDGNGRWATQRGLERQEGHIAGAEAVSAAVRAAAKAGVDYVTLYTFSTENWGRPEAEINAIMELFCHMVASRAEELAEQGVRVKIMGERSRFSEKVLSKIDDIEQTTAEGKRLTLILAFNYSSRREMLLATQAIARRVAAGEIEVEDIDEAMFSASLMTADIPDPDLIIRTSGEYRLSNFLLWQASYSELYFPEVLWPDFGEEDFNRALEMYAGRERRYGLVTDKEER
ncbi:MAG: di-trans,poly-cis-decaprenylcistransferase [Alistipes sp.]|jgi:undecaprenyl diphosphate synthase|nr:di-trans,poly-cis-decaprenylcistransferase [Alistipes sp.]MBQ2141937.1 di-trans,poly-cis-decaprenylcistransferase [Alistipes sp.]MBR5771364.1 di-trans,poly-cis-decaprenylcistransferase [Alistipes sp.]